MKVDGVFSGGGAKALAFIGALEILDEQGYSFQRVAGTSAGAIVASLVTAGYKADDLKEMLMGLSFENVVDTSLSERLFPLSKWLTLYFQLGLFKGKRLENLLEQWLKVKGVRTFSDLPKGSLKVVCSDLTLGRMVVLPDDLKRLYGIAPETFSVAKAVRMSAGLPYFYMPVKLHGARGKSLIVDGGVLSNFPIWIWENERGKRKRPIIGMQLSDPPDQLPERKIRNAIQMFHALFRMMKQAHDARYISKSTSKDVIFIPVKEVETTDFDITDQQKELLMKLGRDYAKAFLKRWK